MTTRTIPDVFPQVSERDVRARKALSADLIRRIAQCQNYLWANIRRTYANTAYEGNGAELDGDNLSTDLDSAYEVLPGGSYGGGVCVACPIIPPNWGASSRLKVQGRSILTLTGGSFGRVVAAVFELDGTYTGVAEIADGLLAATEDWELEIAIPRGRAVQLKLYVGGTLAAGDLHGVQYISARFENGNAAELAGDDPADWAPLAHFAAAELPASAALLRALVRNTNALWAQRNPEVFHTYLEKPSNEYTTYEEVARYTFYLPPKITAIHGYLDVFCTHTGAGNDVRVYVDGVLKETSATLAAGIQSVALTAANFTGLSDGAEHILTIEARSTAAVTDWGTLVWGVYFWEEDVTLGLPGGTSVPATYSPIDEDLLEADDEVLYSALLKLQQNDTWLARHRLRGLIGDWRHRVYKRYDYENGSAVRINPRWDWTRGLETETRELYRPKNITVTASVGGDGQANLVFDRIAALTLWPYGLSQQSPVGIIGDNEWPPDTAHTYLLSGRRLGRCLVSAPVGATLHSSASEGTIRAWVRGNRARPAMMTQSDNGYGPTPEEQGWVNTAFLRIYANSTFLVATMPMRSADGEDHIPRWYGPARIDLPYGTPCDINYDGHLAYEVKGPGALGAWRREGCLFETESRGVLILDDPKSQTQLEALA